MSSARDVTQAGVYRDDAVTEEDPRLRTEVGDRRERRLLCPGKSFQVGFGRLQVGQILFRYLSVRFVNFFLCQYKRIPRLSVKVGDVFFQRGVAAGADFIDDVRHGISERAVVRRGARL